MAGILIADDEKVILLLLRRTLEHLGFLVAGEASNGKEAVEKSLSLNPDAVILDIHMPGLLDGIDAAFEIQKKRNIPVIFLTAYSLSMYEERLKRIKYAAYLTKPFDFKELENSLKKILHPA